MSWTCSVAGPGRGRLVAALSSGGVCRTWRVLRTGFDCVAVCRCWRGQRGPLTRSVRDQRVVRARPVAWETTASAERGMMGRAWSLSVTQTSMSEGQDRLRGAGHRAMTAIVGGQTQWTEAAATYGSARPAVPPAWSRSRPRRQRRLARHQTRASESLLAEPGQ
jgi:hypothetical protein